LLQADLGLQQSQLLEIAKTAIASAIREGRDKLIAMLEAFQRQLPGFGFIVTHPEGSTKVTSFIVQTAAQRRRLLLYGDVIFVDGSEKTNNVHQ
jgi:hypothetical protein